MTVEWKHSSASFFFLGVAVGLVLSNLSIAKKREPARPNKRSKERVANLSNDNEAKPAARRYGAAIGLKRYAYIRYRQLHDNVWHEVLDRMSRSNIRNFTIYYHEETSTLFQHFEWTGHWNHGDLSKEEEDALFAADMQKIADDPVTRKWWAECEPCQEPFSQWHAETPPPSEGGEGKWWAPLECVTHCGHWPIAYSSQMRDPDFVKMHEI